MKNYRTCYDKVDTNFTVIGFFLVIGFAITGFFILVIGFAIFVLFLGINKISFCR